MKRFTFLMFGVDPSQRAALRRALADIDIGPATCDQYELVGDSYCVRMSSDDARVDKLITAVEKLRNRKPLCRREIEYDRKDLEAAEYLKIRITRAERGNTGPLQETEYDLSTGCPECGTGARQISPLRISASALPKKGRVAQTYIHEAIVDDALATELRIDLRSDRGLRQVEDRRSREPLPWWQIIPDTYMPPLDPATKGVSGGGCPRCRRDGFGQDLDNPFEPAYCMSEADRRKLPDFVFTWEHFGVSRLKWEPGKAIGLAYPGTLVSNRAMRVFLKHRIRGVKFIPVRFL